MFKKEAHMSFDKGKKRAFLFSIVLTGVLLCVPALFGQTVQVTIVDFAFDPQNLEIEIGTTVQWTNFDGATHTTTANDGTWDSGNLSQGESFSFTFNETGTFDYICDIHPFMTGTVEVTMPTPAEDEINASVPDGFELFPNYPNPFNPGTNISYALPSQADVRVEVFNILGEKVITLKDGVQPAGNYTVTWDSKDSKGNPVSSGIYFYRVSTDGHHAEGKMMLVR
ncbi:MAG: T9SS type A sorting domain-containing protein [candidate division Zixibacteria bacterium]|nr:T9SS type A sorting domain-containing protein [candidate division Zixibacteria bacterium]